VQERCLPATSAIGCGPSGRAHDTVRLMISWERKLLAPSLCQTGDLRRWHNSVRTIKLLEKGSRWVLYMCAIWSHRSRRFSLRLSFAKENPEIAGSETPKPGDTGYGAGVGRQDDSRFRGLTTAARREGVRTRGSAPHIQPYGSVSHGRDMSRTNCRVD
jgi:hypothetical protein